MNRTNLAHNPAAMSPVLNMNALEALNKSKIAPARRTPLVSQPGPAAQNARQNHLLAALPDTAYELLLPYLELVSIPANTVLWEVNDEVEYVYFLTDSIVSLQVETEDGASAETAVIGNEGLVGVACCLGVSLAQGRAVVKTGGYGYRMKSCILKQAFGRSIEIQQVLLRYTQALYCQTAQMAVCNRHHNVAQQLCRLLLSSLDRVRADELFMKQDAMAAMLGVRRESVTAAATKLQEEGLIGYQRGQITIHDRAGLERRVCECYAVVKKEYDHLSCCHQA
ncbi:Crp/Fnr family transcriptional regulator [soil metagenome]